MNPSTLNWALYAAGTALLVLAAYKGQSLTAALTAAGTALVGASGINAGIAMRKA